MLLGNVYCSRQHTPMTELDTGAFSIRASVLEETDDHISRLSIRCVLTGDQYYRVGSNDHRLNSNNYLLVNRGQHYRTSFRSEERQEMMLVAFRPGFAEKLLHALVTPADRLLDDPFHVSGQPVDFFERTYPRDEVIGGLFRRLKQIMDMPAQERYDIDLDSIYTSMLTRILEVHRGLRPDIEGVEAVRKSTRVELYRRLHIARDFMEAHANRPLLLHEVARAAGLSLHHFKREFLRFFHITPHQYLVQHRLERARQLLNNSHLSVDDIRMACGFENTSSFIRLFRQHTGITPGAFRRDNR